MQRIPGPGGAYTLSVPAGWKVQWRGNVLGAEEPGGNLGLMVAVSRTQAYSLHQYVQFMIRYWQQEVPGWTKLDESPVRVAGHPGMLIRATGRPRGQYMLAHYYLLLTPTQQILLTFTCRPSDEGKWKAAVKDVVTKFETTGPPPATPLLPFGMSPQPARMKLVQDAGGAFAISLPGDWQVKQQPGGVVATDPTGAANVMIITQPKTAATLDQFHRLSVAQMQRQVPGWRQLGMRATRVGQRQGIHMQAIGQPGGIPAVGNYYVVLGTRHQVVLSMLCRQHETLKWQMLFQQMAASFRVP